MKLCSWCDNSFKPSVSYQIYCGVECRDAATKEKIIARYAITRRQKRKNKPRKCVTCGAALSMYNDDTLCDSCIINKKDVLKILKQMKGFANDRQDNKER